MDENNKQSMEEGRTQFLNTKANLEESEGEDEKDEEDEGLEEEEYYEDEEEEEQTGVNELEGNSTKPIRTEPLKSETLAASVALASPLQVSNSDLLSDFSASSPLLSEVPVEYSLQLLDSNKFKDQVGVNHQKALSSVPADAFVAQPLNQFPLHRCTSSSSGLSPASVTRPTFSGPGPTPEQKLLSAANGASECVPEAIHQNYSNHRTGYTASTGKASSSDGYNWRKYGQKQVKSPQGSRSYYKCTCSECRAKKIECCDQSSRVVEIIYKGQHNHDPPQKVKSTRESRLALSAFGSNISSHPVRMLTDLDPSTSSRQHVQEGIPITETKQENLSGSDGDVGTDVMEEYINEPEPKRRQVAFKFCSDIVAYPFVVLILQENLKHGYKLMYHSGFARVKQGRSEYPETFFKSGKKPKFVLHAAGDVGISGDGYRWRKYGQKMVKGNPHPRNYYRCTSAGCPVRKHIERAVDSTTGVIITYKGVHDHDMPVPKKRHGPPSASLVAAAAPTSMNNLQFKKTEVVQDQVSATKWSVDKEGELTSETLDHGGEKAMESARTLLSIGFEIKPF